MRLTGIFYSILLVYFVAQPGIAAPISPGKAATTKDECEKLLAGRSKVSLRNEVKSSLEILEATTIDARSKREFLNEFEAAIQKITLDPEILNDLETLKLFKETILNLFQSLNPRDIRGKKISILGMQLLRESQYDRVKEVYIILLRLFHTKVTPKNFLNYLKNIVLTSAVDPNVLRIEFTHLSIVQALFSRNPTLLKLSDEFKGSIESQYEFENRSFPVTIDGTPFQISKKAMEHTILGEWAQRPVRDKNNQVIYIEKVLAGGLHTERGLLNLFDHCKKCQLINHELDMEKLLTIDPTQEKWKGEFLNYPWAGLAVPRQSDEDFYEIFNFEEWEEDHIDENSVHFARNFRELPVVRIPAKLLTSEALNNTLMSHNSGKGRTAWKSIFPGSWNTNTILAAASEVLRNPITKSQKGTLAAYVGQYKASEHENAIEIQVNTAGNEVMSIFPVIAANDPVFDYVTQRTQTEDLFDDNHSILDIEKEYQIDAAKFLVQINEWSKSSLRDVNIVANCTNSPDAPKVMFEILAKLPADQRPMSSRLVKLAERLTADAKAHMKELLAEDAFDIKSSSLGFKVWIHYIEELDAYFKIIGDSKSQSRLAPQLKYAKQIKTTFSKMKE